MTEFEGSRGFLNIPVGIARDKRLANKPKAILLMGEIISMLNVTGEFYMSNSTLANRLQCTKRTVQDNLTLLEKCGYIKRITTDSKENTKTTTKRKIVAGSNLVKSTSWGWCNTFHGGGEAHFTGGMKSTSPKENNIREHIKKDNSRVKPDHVSEIKEIIDYLNKKTGSNYRASSTRTKAKINARFNEGFETADFKKVIDNKVADWSSDEKMAKFLRPETLFGNKFEGYLNQQTSVNAEHGGFDPRMLARLPRHRDDDDDLPF